MESRTPFAFPAGLNPGEVAVVEEFASERTFTVWDFQPDKRTLLLRGPGAEYHIDLIFHGVFWMELPPEFTGLILKAPRRAKLSRLHTRLGRTLKPNEQVFVLSSGTERYHLGAQLLYIERSTLPPTDPDFYTGNYLHQSQDEDFYKTHVTHRLQFKFPTKRRRAKG